MLYILRRGYMGAFMNNHVKNGAVAVALMFSASMLAGCAPPETALVAAPVPKSHARLIIHREGSVVGMVADARVRVDGRDVASLGNDEVKVLDIPAGAHQIAVDHWSHPGVSKLDLNAKPGTVYEIRAAVRGEAAAAGMMFGLAGSAIESASNGDAGFWSLQLVKQRPAA
jgi:hypothetical protein